MDVMTPNISSIRRCQYGCNICNIKGDSIQNFEPPMLEYFQKYITSMRLINSLCNTCIYFIQSYDIYWLFISVCIYVCVCVWACVCVCVCVCRQSKATFISPHHQYKFVLLGTLKCYIMREKFRNLTCRDHNLMLCSRNVYRY